MTYRLPREAGPPVTTNLRLTLLLHNLHTLFKVLSKLQLAAGATLMINLCIPYEQ